MNRLLYCIFLIFSIYGAKAVNEESKCNDAFKGGNEQAVTSPPAGEVKKRRWFRGGSSPALPLVALSRQMRQDNETAETQQPATAVKQNETNEAQQPAAETQRPTTETQQPAAETQRPTPETQQPATETQQPVAAVKQNETNETQQPVAETQRPTTETSQPATETQRPTPETQQPVAETQRPTPETSQPATETQQPASPEQHSTMAKLKDKLKLKPRSQAKQKVPKLKVFLKPRNLRKLTEEEVQNFSKEDLQQFNSRQILAVLRFLNMEQLTSLKKEQIEELVKQDTSHLQRSSGFIRSLTPDHVATLIQAGKWTFSLKKLSAHQLTKIPDEYIQEMSVQDLQQLDTTQLRTIQNKLSAKQIHHFPKKLLRKFSIHTLTIKQISAKTKDQTETEDRGIPPQYIPDIQLLLHPRQIPHLSQKQTTALNTKHLTVPQVQKLTVEQLILIIMPGQKSTFLPGRSSLPPELIQALTKAQIEGLLKTQLPKKVLKALRKHLDPLQIVALSDAQQQQLQFRAFSRSQWAQVEDTKKLNKEQIDSMLVRYPKKAAFVPIEQINQLTSSRLMQVLTYLSPQQIAGLSLEQVRKIESSISTLLKQEQIQALTKEHIEEAVSVYTLQSIRNKMLLKQKYWTDNRLFHN